VPVGYGFAARFGGAPGGGTMVIDDNRVTGIFDSTTLSMEFLVTGTERRDNHFKLEELDKLI
jgi:hypothetical protein